MNRTTLLALGEQLLGGSIRLMRAKNEQYADEADPIANYRAAAAAAGCTVIDYLCGRLGEKLHRIRNMHESGQITEEQAWESVEDIPPFAVLILFALLEDVRDEG